MEVAASSLSTTLKRWLAYSAILSNPSLVDFHRYSTMQKLLRCVSRRSGRYGADRVRPVSPAGCRRPRRGTREKKGDRTLFVPCSI
ncbi:hypothetical protein BDM02DRAFT_3122913 [Thelephora ganbajun]|uniref:Uncharacterized protein n=1 Tax=Thelephora ganbajun TaxID=370292 RepID=A0ACB6Z352_THEGA|nr:hypothetical protein BDM02DRAFT_3122913 [Thelephora ganbajun]